MGGNIIFMKHRDGNTTNKWTKVVNTDEFIYINKTVTTSTWGAVGFDYLVSEYTIIGCQVTNKTNIIVTNYTTGTNTCGIIVERLTNEGSIERLANTEITVNLILKKMN